MAMQWTLTGVSGYTENCLVRGVDVIARGGSQGKSKLPETSRTWQSFLDQPWHPLLALVCCTLEKAAFALIVLLWTDEWRGVGWGDCCSWLLITLCTTGYPVPNAQVQQPPTDHLRQLHDWTPRWSSLHTAQPSECSVSMLSGSAGCTSTAYEFQVPVCKISAWACC